MVTRSGKYPLGLGCKRHCSMRRCFFHGSDNGGHWLVVAGSLIFRPPLPFQPASCLPFLLMLGANCLCVPGTVHVIWEGSCPSVAPSFVGMLRFVLGVQHKPSESLEVKSQRRTGTLFLAFRGQEPLAQGQTNCMSSV